MTSLNEATIVEAQNKGIIVCLSRRVGFFALFFQVLGHIYQAEQEDLIPVVFFGSSCLYWSEQGYNGHQDNAWEYYFEPVSELTIEDVFNLPLDRLKHASIYEYSKADITHNPPEQYTGNLQGSISVPPNVKVTNCWSAFDPGQEEIHEDRRAIFYDLIKRRIQIKPSILNKIDDFYQSYFTDNTVIGVHMRGTERSVEVTGWYLKPHLDERTYMRAVDRALKQFPDAKIFLATDTQTSVDKFRSRYGDRLLTYDSTRSDEGNSPHLQFGGAVLGEQVLIESILLSKTNFLIHGISNVAFAALCFNPTLSHLNVYLKYGKAGEIKLRVNQKLQKVLKKIKRRLNTLVKK
ncbi:nodulation protein NodZ [Spirulina subsalsa FACHB-351]|uniref:Nodulation protein NodZ n=1 Tax=Spirulina subsalsa FACHB-351 TaxID=234711 RepID=A0ABT3L931_9CYAN|nr:nodulation protein NodZ [Spirulina subsalsa]MCW6038016.1 nodulation protein NodZ [Spirulina subsalsa FACHB-351]